MGSAATAPRSGEQTGVEEAPNAEPAPGPAQAAVEVAAVSPVLTVRAAGSAPIGTMLRVETTLTPAAAAEIVVQRQVGQDWRDIATGEGAADGTASLQVTAGIENVGVHTLRIAATVQGRAVMSEPFVFRRTALVKVNAWLQTKVIRFGSWAYGSIAGTNSRTVELQYNDKGVWRTVGRSTADAKGGFKVELVKKDSPGTYSYRVKASSSLGAVYSSTFTQTRIVGWKATISNTTASQVRYTYKRGCPVGTSGLSTITMTHWTYGEKISSGMLIVRRDVATQVRDAFKNAFYAGFPINRLSNPDVWKANDVAMMAANNTSAFNCRKVTGNPYRVSPHSYGRAIDVNTYENPYRVGGKWYPSAKYGTYRPKVTGLLRSDTSLVKELKKRGFAWYSGWDWQHFQK